MSDGSQTGTRSLAWLRRSLARDTASLVLGLCLVTAVLTDLTAREVVGSALRSNFENDLNREFEHVQAKLEIWRANELEEISRLATDRELAAALASGAAGAARAHQRLSTLLETKPTALGFAILRSRGGRTAVSVGPWLPENWAAQLGQRAPPRGSTVTARIGDSVVELVGVPLKVAGEQVVFLAALNPLLSIELVAEQARVRSAIVDERGELLMGSQAALDLAGSLGFTEARNPEGVSYLALRRTLSNTPWQMVIAKPTALAPAGTITMVVLASLVIACVAGVVAFVVGVWRLRPLLDLADGARRLAAGELGVRVDVRNAHDEVQTLARSFNEMAGQLEEQRRAVEDRNQELLRANEVLEQLSITDGLTHLHNHRHFHDQFARETKRSERSGQPLCLLLVDIDDFKLLNDRYGHAAGDRVLAVTAQVMNAQVRESDYLARYGGEEFAILVPQTNLEGAIALAEKVRGVLAEHSFLLPDSEESVHVTVSIGVAEHSTTVDETFDAADRALYDAKGAGKDCVVSAAPLDRPTSLGGRRRR